MPRKQRAEGTRAPNGAATVYLAKDGRWHGRVTMGLLDNGQPDRRHVSAKTEAEVLTKVRALEKDRDAGRTKRPGRAWTVEKWLDHWLENIAGGSVRPKTYAGYSSAVRKHLIPGLGAHRTDRLTPEQIEKFYRQMGQLEVRGKPIKPGTVHHVHRTLRAALNEALKRGQIVTNPALIARAPRLEEEEIVPLTVKEAAAIMRAATHRRNGVRFAVALALGLRQGEAIGLRWEDMSTKDGGKALLVRRAIQRHTWRHGCERSCGRKRGADCPKRYGGGLVVVPTKSRAGRRSIGVPDQLWAALLAHKEVQQAEKEYAANLWHDDGWMFAQPTGKPLDPRDDYDEWQSLLKEAGVRPARLHDARHTAATVLLVLKVPTRSVMEVMGWSQASMAVRYQHVPMEVLTGIADQVSGLLWKDEPPVVPPPKRPDEDGSAGTPVAA